MVEASYKLPILENPKDLRSRTIQSPQCNFPKLFNSKCQSLLNFESELIKRAERGNVKSNKFKKQNFAEYSSNFDKEKYYDSFFASKSIKANTNYKLETEMVTSFRAKNKADRHKMSNLTSLDVDETVRRYLCNWSISWDPDLEVNLSREKLDEPIKPTKSKINIFEEESLEIYYPDERLAVNRVFKKFFYKV
jgi:hypothetical protein